MEVQEDEGGDDANGEDADKDYAEDAVAAAMETYLAKKTELGAAEKELSRKRKAFESSEREQAIEAARSEVRKRDAELLAAQKAKEAVVKELDRMLKDDGGIAAEERKVRRLKEEKSAAFSKATQLASAAQS